jgi:hypothetical protein
MREKWEQVASQYQCWNGTEVTVPRTYPGLTTDDNASLIQQADCSSDLAFNCLELTTRPGEATLLCIIKPAFRMASSGMLRRMALVRTDVSEELRASIIRVTRIGKLGTMLAVASNRLKLRRLSALVASYC